MKAMQNPLAQMKKTNLVIAGTILAFGTFVLGLSFNEFPEFSAKKYRMPASHRVNLRATTYEIWYFQSRKNTKFDATKRYLGASTEFPKLSIKDVNGNSLSYEPSSTKNGPRFIHSGDLALLMGKIKVKRSGVYLLATSFGKEHSIALVPPTAKDSIDNKGPSGPMFNGFFDEPIEPR